MTDMNNREPEYTAELSGEEECCGECCECGQSAAGAIFESYCDNLVFPDEDKCIEPKKLYITLGAAFAGAVALFLFIGWLLCYCPINTTGFTAEDFIAEYNAIVSDGDVNRDAIDATIAAMAESPEDAIVLYPDFSDLTIPEDADLEKGVELCGGDMLVKADLVGGKIQKLTVSISDDCTSYDSNVYSFIKSGEANYDYSALPHYAAAGKARLAFYNLVRRQNGQDPVTCTLGDAVNYCMGMRQGSYYSFADAEDYNPDHTYFEYTENLMLYFAPANFCFTADSREKTLVDSDNGIYDFFDAIFGKKEKEDDKDIDADTPAVSTPADDASGADASSSDVSASDAE